MHCIIDIVILFDTAIVSIGNGFVYIAIVIVVIKVTSPLSNLRVETWCMYDDKYLFTFYDYCNFPEMNVNFLIV